LREHRFARRIGDGPRVVPEVLASAGFARHGRTAIDLRDDRTDEAAVERMDRSTRIARRVSVLDPSVDGGEEERVTIDPRERRARKAIALVLRDAEVVDEEDARDL